MSALCLPARPAVAAGSELGVDLGAVAANTRLLAGRTGAAVMAVVKADGFGHGAVDVARTALAHGATWLGVTALAEAVPLRAAGLTAPLLSWLNPPSVDVAAALELDADLAVPGLAHLAALSGGVRVHLHLDTGLARDGADPREWLALCRAAARAERQGRVRVVGVMGHLARADEPGDPANREGRERFAHGVRVARRCGLRPVHRHLAATAATLTDPASHHTMVRVGAGLVGIDPSGTTALRGALTLGAPLVQVREVAAGTPVGYGHTWRAPTRTRLGLLPLGYADGLPRVAGDRAEVLVVGPHGGRRCPLAGRVSMDQVVVDLGAGSGEQPGDRVVALGPGDAGEPTAADWARWSGTLPHEVVTGIGPRPTRVVTPAPRLRGLS